MDSYWTTKENPTLGDVGLILSISELHMIPQKQTYCATKTYETLLLSVRSVLYRLLKF